MESVPNHSNDQRPAGVVSPESEPQGVPSGARRGGAVPRWLVALTAVLALGVLVTGGMAVSRVMRERQLSPAENLRIERAKKSVAQAGTTTARLQLAYAYQRAGDYGRAERTYRDVLSEDPRSVAALYNLGIVAELSGDKKGARAEYERVLAIDPTHLPAVERLGRLLAEQAEWQVLGQVVRPALNAHPDMADLHYLLGLSLEKQGKGADAAREYTKALEFAPELADARSGLERVR